MENTFTSEDEPKQVYSKNSVRRKFRTTKIPHGENSVRQKFRTAKIPTAKIPTANIPATKDAPECSSLKR